MAKARRVWRWQKVAMARLSVWLKQVNGIRLWGSNHVNKDRMGEDKRGTGERPRQCQSLYPEVAAQAQAQAQADVQGTFKVTTMTMKAMI